MKYIPYYNERMSLDDLFDLHRRYKDPVLDHVIDSLHIVDFMIERGYTHSFKLINTIIRNNNLDAFIFFSDRGYYDPSSLSMACKLGNVRFARYILNNDIDKKICVGKHYDKYGSNIYINAIITNHTEIVRLLSKTKYRTTNNSNLTFAIKNKNVELVHILIAAGDKMNSAHINLAFKMQLYVVCDMYCTDTMCIHDATIRKLLELNDLYLIKKIDPHMVYSQYYIDRVPYIAMGHIYRHIDIVKYFVSLGYNMRVRAYILNNCFDTVKYLFDIGFDKYNADDVRIIIRKGYHPIAKYVLDKHITRNIIDECARRYLDLLKMSIKNGDNPTEKTLDIAVKNGRMEIVRYLISVGCKHSLFIVDNAINAHYNSIVRYLTSVGIFPFLN